MCLHAPRFRLFGLSNLFLGLIMGAIAVGSVFQLYIGNSFEGALGLVGLLVLSFIQLILPLLLKIRIAPFFRLLMSLVFMGSPLLGYLFDFFERYRHFDKIMHFSYGLIIAYGALIIFYVLIPPASHLDLSLHPLIVVIFVWGFSLTVLLGWELFEFFCDRLLSTNMQCWQEGVIAALTDTTLDLLYGFGGALIVSVLFLIGYKRNYEHFYALWLEDFFMKYFTEQRPLDDYLKATKSIDFLDPRIRFVADWLMDTMMQDVNEKPEQLSWPEPEIELAARTYKFVRDRIANSCDSDTSENVWIASHVLDKRTGNCYGKSHLLVALLRANGIPAALCYQYLRLDRTENSPLVIYGLAAVYLSAVGKWLRLDARGNKPGVMADFSIDAEQVAFPINPTVGETDLPLLMVSTDKAVDLKLRKYQLLKDLLADLPTRIAGKSAK